MSKVARLSLHRKALQERIFGLLKEYDHAQCLPEEEMLSVMLMALSDVKGAIDIRAEKLLKEMA